jgi:hypothetical protein
VADGDEAASSVADEEEEEECEAVYDEDDMLFDSQPGAQGPGRGFETAQGSLHDMGQQWGRVKEYDLRRIVYCWSVRSHAYLHRDFAQAKTMGYRPGLTQVSNDWASSFLKQHWMKKTIG